MNKHMIWTLALGSLVFAGCGPAEVKTNPASGTVFYQDKPLEGAAVTFVPSEVGAASAAGVTDAEGKFTLKTGLKDGAAAGKYKVAISKIDASEQGGELDDSKAATLKMADTPMLTEDSLSESLIPAKYQSPASSGLTESVEEGKSNVFEFKLTD